MTNITKIDLINSVKKENEKKKKVSEVASAKELLKKYTQNEIKYKGKKIDIYA